MTLPNFLIIGAHKSGTTSLHEYLKGHPQVFMSPRKELRYFAYDNDNPDHRSKVPRVFPVTTLSKYRDCFKAVSSEKVIGESSPEYLNSAFAAAKIKATIPDAQLIASLREPVGRTYSAYIMSRKSGIEERPFEVVLADRSRELQESLYYDKVKLYMDLFGKERFKVVLFEDLVNSPTDVMKGIFGFLNIDDSFVPDLEKKHNVGGLPRNRMVHKMLSNRTLKSWLGPMIKGGMRRALVNVRTKNLEKAPPMSEKVKAELRTYFREDVEKLQGLLNRDLSGWMS